MCVEKPKPIPVVKTLCGDEIEIHSYQDEILIQCTEALGHKTDHSVTNPDILIQRYNIETYTDDDLELVTIMWRHKKPK